MKQLNQKEKQQIKEQVQKKLKIYEEMKQQIDILMRKEPFKTKYDEIIKIKNRMVREEKLKQLYRELNLIIKNNKKDME